MAASPREGELAWAAGLFDGDGWVGCVRSGGRVRVRANVTQVGHERPRVLVRFRDVVGVGSIARPTANRPRHWAWVSSGSSVSSVMGQLWPWLGDVKRTQYLVAAACRLDVGFASADSPIATPAWAAGFFDAEGYIGAVRVRRVRSETYIRPRASVEQRSLHCVPEVLIRFHAAIGSYGAIQGPKLRARREPIYVWQSAKQTDIDAVVATLSPWLGPIKRLAFEVVTQRLAGQAPLTRGGGQFGRTKTVCKRGHDYSDARSYTVVLPSGNSSLVRICRPCAAERDRAARMRRRASAR